MDKSTSSVKHSRPLWRLGSPRQPWQNWYVPILVGTTITAEARGHTFDVALITAQTICDAVNGVQVTDPVRDALVSACAAVLRYHRNPDEAEQTAYDASAGNVTGLDALLGQVEAALVEAGGNAS